jgi:tetratricopeptide (TPR) repeat protein
MGAPQPVGTPQGAQRDWGAWIKEHTRELGFGVGAVMVLAAAGWLYVTSEARKQAFAAQALTQARSDAEAGNLPLAANDLSRIIDRYAGSNAADEAAVLLNQIRLVQGQTADAVKDLQSFVQKGHQKYVLASAWSLLGGGLEEQHKYRDAAQAYRRASEEATHDFLKAQYLLDAGRTLAVAGDSTASRAAYAEVIQKYGELAQAAEARVRLGELGGTAPPATVKAPPRSAG